MKLKPEIQKFARTGLVALEKLVQRLLFACTLAMDCEGPTIETPETQKPQKKVPKENKRPKVSKLAKSPRIVTKKQHTCSPNNLFFIDFYHSSQFFGCYLRS